MLNLGQQTEATFFAGGNLFFLFASALWAVLTMLSTKIQKTVHFVIYSIYIYTIASLIALAFSLVRGDFSAVPLTLSFTLNILYISLGATSIGTTIYFISTTKIGSRRASTFIFMVPATALFFSWVFLGEIPKITTLLGGALTVAAVYILNSRRKEKKELL